MKEELLNFIEYNHWANKRCIKSLGSGSDIDKKAEDLYSHMIAAQLIWLTRITGKDFNLSGPFHIFNKDEFYSLSELTYNEWNSYINNSDEKDFNKNLSYLNYKGESYFNTIYDIIMHVSHHSAYHRGQIASMVRVGGGTPAVTDYIAYMRE